MISLDGGELGSTGESPPPPEPHFRILTAPHHTYPAQSLVQLCHQVYEFSKFMFMMSGACLAPPIVEGKESLFI